MAGIGAWLFRQRGWLPVPLLLVALVQRPTAWAPGLVLVALGEGVRLAAVGHIGAPSRTRGADVGPLVTSGPYGWVRNPLYVGNLLMWAGVGVIQWPAALGMVPLLAGYYQLIVAWEEENLARTLGAPYRAYREAVPRWLPRRPRQPGGGTWSPSRAFRSERSTLLALAVVLGLLGLRSALG